MGPKKQRSAGGEGDSRSSLEGRPLSKANAALRRRPRPRQPRVRKFICFVSLTVVNGNKFARHCNVLQVARPSLKSGVIGRRLVNVNQVGGKG